MSFPRAPNKRFNETQGAGPPVGAYNVYCTKGTTFVTPLSRQSSVSDIGSECSTMSAKKGGSQPVPSSSTLMSFDLEMRRLLRERRDLQRQLVYKIADNNKLDGRLHVSQREKTQLMSQVATTNKECRELRRKRATLEAMVRSYETKYEKKQNIQNELARVCGKLATAEMDLSDAILELNVLRKQEKAQLVNKDTQTESLDASAGASDDDPFDDAESTRLRLADLEEQLAILKRSYANQEKMLSQYRNHTEFTDEASVALRDRLDSDLLSTEDELLISNNHRLELERVIEGLRSEIDELVASNHLMSNEKSKVEDDNYSHLSAIRELKTELEKLHDHLNDSNSSQECLQLECKALQATINNLNDQVKIQLDGLETETKRCSQLEADLSDLNDRFEGLKLKHRAEIDRMAEINDDLQIERNKLADLKEKQVAEIVDVHEENERFVLELEGLRADAATLKIKHQAEVTALEEQLIERKAAFDNLVDIDEKAFRAIQDELAEARADLERKEDDMNLLCQEFISKKDELRELNIELMDKVAECLSKSEELALKQNEYEDLKLHYGELLEGKAAIKAELDAATQQCDSKIKLIAELELRNKSLKIELENYRIQTDIAQSELSLKASSYDKLEKSASATKIELNAVLRELALKTEMIKHLEIDFKLMSDEFDDMKEQSANLAVDLHERNGYLESVMADLGKANSDLDTMHLDLARVSEEAAGFYCKLQENGAELDRVKSELQTKNSELEKSHREFESKSIELRKTLYDKDLKCAELDERNLNLEANFNELKVVVSEQERVNADLTGKVSELEFELQSADIERDLIANLNKTVEALRLEVAKKESELISYRDKMAEMEDEVESLKEDVDEKEGKIIGFVQQVSNAQLEVESLKNAENRHYVTIRELQSNVTKLNARMGEERTSMEMEIQNVIAVNGTTIMSLQHDNGNLREQIMRLQIEIEQMQQREQSNALKQRIEDLHQENGRLRAEVLGHEQRERQLQEDLAQYESETFDQHMDEIGKAETMAELRSLAKRYAQLLGHNNPLQKIRHVEKVMKEKRDLQIECGSLREQLYKLQRQQSAQKSEPRRSIFVTPMQNHSQNNHHRNSMVDSGSHASPKLRRKENIPPQDHHSTTSVIKKGGGGVDPCNLFNPVRPNDTMCHKS